MLNSDFGRWDTDLYSEHIEHIPFLVTTNQLQLQCVQILGCVQNTSKRVTVIKESLF